MKPEDAKRLEEIRADEAKYGEKWAADSSDARFLLRMIDEQGKAIEFVRASLLGGLKAVLFVNGKPEGDSEELVPARSLLRGLDALLGKDHP